MIVQALLGATRVLLGHAAVVATIHAMVAQIFFITTVSLAVLTSPWGHQERPPIEDSVAPRLTTLAYVTTLVVLVQSFSARDFVTARLAFFRILIGAVAVAVPSFGRAALRKNVSAMS